MCVCVCVCVQLGRSRLFKHVSLNNKDLFKILSSFLIDALVPWETVSPKKIVHMLVLPLQLFPDDLQWTLTFRSIDFHLKNHFIPKSKFRKILVENTTIIAYKIDKLRLQILEALHIKKNKINRINFENCENVLKCFQYFYLIFQ